MFNDGFDQASCPKAGLEKWLGGLGDGGRGCILKSNESHTQSQGRRL